MREYLFAVAGLAVVLDFLALISNEKYKKITEAALSIILTLAVVLPLPGLIKDFGELINIEENGGEVSSELYQLSFEDGIREYLADKFALSKNDIEVEAIGFLPERMTAERILITLRGSAVLADNKRIRSAVNDLEIGEAEVKIEI